MGNNASTRRGIRPRIPDVLTVSVTDDKMGSDYTVYSSASTDKYFFRKGNVMSNKDRYYIDEEHVFSSYLADSLFMYKRDVVKGGKIYEPSDTKVFSVSKSIELFVTKTQLSDSINDVRSEIPDVSGFLTSSDLSGYATKSDLDSLRDEIIGMLPESGGK